jgi:glutathione peroxidase
MKGIILILSVLIAVNAFSQNNSIHNFKTLTLEGEEFDMAQLKGKKVLVVNTASKCGLTPQYEDLESLYKTYGGQDFTIIGFPANNFLKQEPGNEEEIREFCTQNYGVTFLMMHKISVKGKDIDPIYNWLTSKEENGVMDSEVKWNFQKYMIDEDGHLVDVVSPKTKPNDDVIINWITAEK